MTPIRQLHGSDHFLIQIKLGVLLLYDHRGGDFPELVFPFEFHDLGFESLVVQKKLIGLLEVIKPFGLDSSVFLVLKLMLDHGDSFFKIDFFLLCIL